MKNIMIVLSSLPLVWSCSNSPSFTSRSVAIDRNDLDAVSGENRDGTDDGNGGGSGDAEYYSVTYNIKSESVPPVDYLFVVDNSTSMNNGMMDKMIKGFEDIAKNGDFPESSRIGLISMAVDAVSQDEAKIVGFKKLVDDNSIAKSFRSEESKLNFPGCKSWFKPNEQDTQGNFCLSSAIKFQLYATRFEAGISAFDNLLTASEGKNLFRKNSLVNVIFFSDTHDIGLNPDNPKDEEEEAAIKTLIERRDSYSNKYFRKRVKDSWNVQSVKFHGMVPVEGKESCGEDVDNYSYSGLISSSGGVQVHCNSQDYSEFISKMVRFSKFATRTLDVDSEKLGSVEFVELDGQSVDFEVDEENSQVVVREVPQFSGDDQVIEVFFKI